MKKTSTSLVLSYPIYKKVLVLYDGVCRFKAKVGFVGERARS